MDMNEKDNCGSAKTEDHLNYRNSSMSSDWQFSNPFSSAQGNQVDSSAFHSMPMVNSLSHSLWNLPTNTPALGLGESSIPASSESAAVGWNPSGSLPSTGTSFLQASLGILPASLSTDPAFIERAARFSMFNAGNISSLSMSGPFSASQFLGPYSNSSRSFLRAEPEKSDTDMIEARNMSSDGVPTKDANFGVSSKDSLESQFSGAASQQDAAQLIGEAGDSSSKDLGAKRRKRTNEDLQPSSTQGTPQMSTEAKIGNAETNQNAEMNSSQMATIKTNGKDVNEDTEAPKPDYIHIRARRGQATNSHSLAERLRREKISERMKLLQDLVPGCSKVTGKAVMLDEIINYVQSLQRQVEFLSMKLATVSPSLDFNIEALLSKEIFQNNCGPSSAIDFVPDIVHPQLHMQQQGLLPSGISVALNPPDSLRRAINAQLTAMNGYKEPVHNVWNEEIQNTLQMNYSGNPNLHMQEYNKP